MQEQNSSSELPDPENTWKAEREVLLEEWGMLQRKKQEQEEQLGKELFFLSRICSRICTLTGEEMCQVGQKTKPPQVHDENHNELNDNMTNDEERMHLYKNIHECIRNECRLRTQLMETFLESEKKLQEYFEVYSTSQSCAQLKPTNNQELENAANYFKNVVIDEVKFLKRKVLCLSKETNNQIGKYRGKQVEFHYKSEQSDDLEMQDESCPSIKDNKKKNVIEEYVQFLEDVHFETLKSLNNLAALLLQRMEDLKAALNVSMAQLHDGEISDGFIEQRRSTEDTSSSHSCHSPEEIHEGNGPQLSGEEIEGSQISEKIKPELDLAQEASLTENIFLCRDGDALSESSSGLNESDKEKRSRSKGDDKEKKVSHCQCCAHFNALHRDVTDALSELRIPDIQKQFMDFKTQFTDFKTQCMNFKRQLKDAKTLLMNVHTQLKDVITELTEYLTDLTKVTKQI